ncbi:cral trio domain containing protein [Grosmannia clavigera kw1407]|uniref:Cral trio domain containing protein n=1 Tax=Grosmannia clavigera (strain kw1407 / UAMH 11150) TaxID=655863 RepID=F0XEG9_GROCL|nr:cral trio domain containing protein [Grosmannia clavigera kw1407]EFX03614.1 cral trio domain containing protein [Grosmannia clavigera kw1407]
MAVELGPGRPGTLTPEQEEKLRQLWAAVFRVCGTDLTAEDDEGADMEPTDSAGKASGKDGKKPDKKKKRSLFHRSKKDGNTADDSSSAASKSTHTVNVNTDDDKYGQGKIYQDALASMTPDLIRATIWSMVKHDHPDALLLRFLRARKWDVDKALVMLVSTMHWRSQDMKVEDLVRSGEGAAVAREGGSDNQAKLSHDFLDQIRMGKSFLHGFDKTGRPICVVRVRLHHQGDQSEESMEQYTVYIIETARMLLQPPVDTATIIFDMTSFSLANMDYTPVKFMIKCFEANYPECLGAVLVHKAPWIFQGIWKIIRGWLDPVVASKVHFTNNVKDMEQFIEKDQILKELDGGDDWEYKFVEPTPGDDDRISDTATRDQLLAKREQLYRQYEVATGEWIMNPEGEKAKALKAERDDIANRMRVDYWKVDPYLRARSLYDRIGLLLPNGDVNRSLHLGIDETTQTPGAIANPATNGEVTASISIDDVE